MRKIVGTADVFIYDKKGDYVGTIHATEIELEAKPDACIYTIDFPVTDTRTLQFFGNISDFQYKMNSISKYEPRWGKMILEYEIHVKPSGRKEIARIGYHRVCFTIKNQTFSADDLSRVVLTAEAYAD